MKDAITKFLENDVELDGSIDNKDDNDMSGGEAMELEKKSCAQHIPILCCPLYVVFNKGCIFVVFATMNIARVWANFH